MPQDADWVEEVVALPDLDVVLRRPRDPVELLDEDAFTAGDEFIPYWAELWPSASALARSLHGRSLGGMRVLEIGCGLGLPSVVAALRGARVTASDWAAEAVDAAAANGRRNGVEITPLVADWRQPSELLDPGPWDLVLAADVLYEQRNLAPLGALLPALCAAGAEVLLADPGRPQAAPFVAGLPLVASHAGDRVTRLRAPDGPAT